MGPLSHIKIVELAGIGPSPFAAMLLADLGAEIIRIDRLGGYPSAPGDIDFYNPGKWGVLNRNRRLVAVDLKSPAGRDLVLSLIDKADGLIEGYRPGVAEKLGLGPDVCLQRNPKLVYGRMTGWGQQGPMAKMAGHDINYLALNGVLHLVGRPGQKPTIPPAIIGDMGGGGMLLAFGMVSAMLNAAKTGQGQVVDASIVDGAALLAAMILGLSDAGLWRPAGENLLDGGPHFYDVYECADGKYVSLGAIEPAFYRNALERLGLADDPDFQDQVDRDKWPAQKARFQEIFRTRARDEWVAHFGAADACFAPVLTPREAAEHPHATARDSFLRTDGVLQPQAAPRFSATPNQHRHTPMDAASHNDQALRDWGLEESMLKKLKADKVIE